jgi:hypothetical protein
MRVISVPIGRDMVQAVAVIDNLHSNSTTDCNTISSPKLPTVSYASHSEDQSPLDTKRRSRLLTPKMIPQPKPTKKQHCQSIIPHHETLSSLKIYIRLKGVPLPRPKTFITFPRPREPPRDIPAQTQTPSTWHQDIFCSGM